MIHYVEGSVSLEGQTVEPKFGEFPEVKNGQTLSTGEGRVEVLLTPGVFLRLAEDSSFKMISNRLADTSLEVVSGSALIEVDELLKDNSILIKVKDSNIELSKHGLYRFDADASRLRVYDGEASVTSGKQTVVARKGRQVDLNGVLVASNFDPKTSDPFYRWASRRSSYIATANVSSARAAGSQGMLSSGYGYGNWAWNPWYGMYTYLPSSGYGYNPFGWAFYSPFTVGNLYDPYAYYGSNAYYGGGGYAQPSPRVPAPSAVAAQSAALARSASQNSFAGIGASQGPNFGSPASSGSVASSGGGGGIATSSGGGVASAPASSGMGASGGARGR
jgi:hypothetical protein